MPTWRSHLAGGDGETAWLGPRELVHRGWDDFPIEKGNHHEKDQTEY
jgi:hypothetical protein